MSRTKSKYSWKIRVTTWFICIMPFKPLSVCIWAWNIVLVRVVYFCNLKSGGDLRNFLEVVGSLEEEESALYFAEMIMAVHDLHELGYLHRDLKPDNCT